MMDRQFMVRVSYLEIYNEEVKDLLTSSRVDVRQKQVSFILFCLFNISSSSTQLSCGRLCWSWPKQEWSVNISWLN